MIESKRLGRSGIGIELLPTIAKLAKERITEEKSLDKKGFSEILVADSRSKKARKTVEGILSKNGKKSLRFLITFNGNIAS